MVTGELLKSCHKECNSYFKSQSTDSTRIYHKIENIRDHSLRVATNIIELAKAVFQNDD